MQLNIIVNIGDNVIVFRSYRYYLMIPDNFDFTQKNFYQTQLFCTEWWLMGLGIVSERAAV